MSVRKPSIPHVVTKEPGLQDFIVATKENIEIITGRRRGAEKIAQLASTATLADVIAKVNETLDRLQ